ncbi:SNF2 family N-terminal domain-containing protein [Paraphoma chrysanthemicola]|nr:SNF2 family N-terminal domain-containing protein [Paraphoma chrysanthemicola]
MAQNFPHSEHADATYSHNEDDCESLAVSLESFHRADPCVFRAIVYNQETGNGTAIVATAPSDLLDSITPHLRTATTLAITQHGKRSRSISRASFTRCLLQRPSPERKTYRLDVELRWTLGLSVVESPNVGMKHMKEDLKLLSRYYPDANAQSGTPWVLSDFYDSVHVPPLDLQVSPRIQHALTGTLLYTFQTRAVDWLLRREGVAFSPSGTLETFVEILPPASFRQTQDAMGQLFHVSQLRGMAVLDLNAANGDALQSLRGGILAEEMGLGKTVELMALMTHHKRPSVSDKIFDAYTGAYVTPSGATLIITPPAILEQWINEVHNHAPELKVFHYKGLPPPSAPKKEHAAATVENLLRYDIVVTTYNVLSKEIHHATPPPDRSSRNARRHERRRSPLVEISWWRVCLDEAQMIESGVSQAAQVARIIPRCNAWAVSGTPLRKDVQDLRGLLIFLRCDAFANNKAVWDRVDKASFKSIFSQIALRHTKDKVRDDLRLPPQKRIVLTVPFTTIEEQNYSDMIRQMCDSCWLTPEGLPLEEGRDASHPEVIERMRDWLVRLRQTCLHAHVGRKNRKALGGKNGALRTVHDVLEVMIEQNDSNWKSDAREMILNHIKMGHVTAYAGNMNERAQMALPYYEEALKDAQQYVNMCREELAAEHATLNRTTAHRDAEEQLQSDSDNENDGENMGRIPVLRKTLRSFLELEHACDFFIATAYHQIKENDEFTKEGSEDFHRLEKLETEWYQKAKLVRRELLRESKIRAQRQMDKIASRRPFHQIPNIDDLPDFGGIESQKILNTMDNITDFLNAQAKQIQIWRMKIVDVLLLRLVDDDDDQETTGEEYDDSLKAQDELYVYIMALRTLIADRNAATHGLQDILVEHELKAAEKQALRKDIDEEKETRGHAPELVIEIAETRRKLQAMLEGGSLKGIVSGVRSLLTGLQWRAEGGDQRAANESEVLQKHLTRIQAIVTQQAKTIADLEKEQEMFRATMNQRLEYYRQFQHISDTVAKYKEELDENFDVREFTRFTNAHERKKMSVAGLKTKHTYLTHLRTENQEDAKAECVICQDLIAVGVLTTCGHKYCKECINTWWRAHRTCPMCKQKLGSSDFKDISFKPSEMRAQEEVTEPASPSQPATPESLNTSIYSDMSDTTLKEIKNIDVDGSYGTKIDMIARHLLWIRANDPGAKSIIFSQFSDFLEVLREALKKWRIGVSGIVDKDGIQKFKSDGAIECFLLDAKSDSSGLNLVNATYVFLCEPLINPAIELQAIARVHRIGQKRATTVFMYLISDTVEEAIYEISVARRLAHISRSSASNSRSGTATPALQENTLDKANSAELQAAPLKALLRKKGNGEEVKADDLWHCLFSKQRKPTKPAMESEVGRHLRAEAAEGRVAAIANVRF